MQQNFAHRRGHGPRHHILQYEAVIVMRAVTLSQHLAAMLRGPKDKSHVKKLRALAAGARHARQRRPTGCDARHWGRRSWGHSGPARTAECGATPSAYGCSKRKYAFCITSVPNLGPGQFRGELCATSESALGHRLGVRASNLDRVAFPVTSTRSWVLVRSSTCQENDDGGLIFGSRIAPYDEDARSKDTLNQAWPMMTF